MLVDTRFFDRYGVTQVLLSRKVSEGAVHYRATLEDPRGRKLAIGTAITLEGALAKALEGWISNYMRKPEPVPAESVVETPSDES